jgi:Protein of unknown function (DUF3159)
LHVIELPGASQILRRAGTTMLVATVLPMTAFYLTFALTGLEPAVAVTVAWYYATLLWRLARGERMLGAALLGAGLLTLRAVLIFWTGSAFLYFIQPVAGTVATASALALTALAGRPLLDRLTHDFFPLPPELTERLRANRFFRYASVVWALIYLVNAVSTVWLLSNSSLGTFLVLKTLLSPLLAGLAVLLTYGLFRALMWRERVAVRWGGRAGTGTVALAPLTSTSGQSYAGVAKKLPVWEHLRRRNATLTERRIHRPESMLWNCLRLDRLVVSFSATPKAGCGTSSLAPSRPGPT